MYRAKAIFSLLMSTLIVSVVYAQEKTENHMMKYVSGTVIGTDAVGDIISIRTDNQKQMAFFVTDKASITQEAHNIGLMDIGKSDSVKIRYYLESTSKYIAVSIVDNESVVNE